MRHGALLLALALLLAGCSRAQQPPAPSAPPPPAPPPAAPPALAGFPLPPVPGRTEPVRPLALQVGPDGKAFALWFAAQADALLAWRTDAGEQPAVLKGAVTRELAWAPDALYFVALDGLMEGRGEIWRYRWQGQPELVVGAGRLHGYPASLTWDPAGSRLLFADQDGLHAAAPDGRQITALAGPWGTGASQGGTFAPGQLRYVTLQGDRLVLGTAGQAAGTPLVTLPGPVLQRVAWAADGRTLAAEVSTRSDPAPQIIVIAVPEDGPARVLRMLAGSQPALLGDSLWYLAPDQSAPMRLRLPDGAPQPLAGTGRVYALSADTAAQRLYLFQDSGTAPVLRLDVSGARQREDQAVAPPSANRDRPDEVSGAEIASERAR